MVANLQGRNLTIRYEAVFHTFSRALPPHASGIRFADFVFSEPIQVEYAICPVASAGIYVLLISDPTWSPRQFQPVYFGEFGVNGQPQMSTAEQMRCLRIASGRSSYLAVHAVPLQHASEVSRVKQELIHQYVPLGNLDSTRGHAESRTRIEDLEKKIAEHEGMLKLLLSSIAQTASNQPEPKKRTAGFLAH